MRSGTLQPCGPLVCHGWRVSVHRRYRARCHSSSFSWWDVPVSRVGHGEAAEQAGLDRQAGLRAALALGHLFGLGPGLQVQRGACMEACSVPGMGYGASGWLWDIAWAACWCMGAPAPCSSKLHSSALHRRQLSCTRTPQLGSTWAHAGAGTRVMGATNASSW